MRSNAFEISGADDVRGRRQISPEPARGSPLIDGSTWRRHSVPSRKRRDRTALVNLASDRPACGMLKADTRRVRAVEWPCRIVRPSHSKQRQAPPSKGL